MDIQSKLFESALGIEEPLYIKEINFDENVGELHIYIDFKRGSKFLCPNCGKEHCTAHDTVEKVWRHLDFSNTNATSISEIQKSSATTAEYDCLFRTGHAQEAVSHLYLKRLF